MGGPKWWGAQNFAPFFPLSHRKNSFFASLSLSLGVFSWNFGGLKRRGLEMWAFGVLGLSSPNPPAGRSGTHKSKVGQIDRGSGISAPSGCSGRLPNGGHSSASGARRCKRRGTRRPQRASKGCRATNTIFRNFSSLEVLELISQLADPERMHSCQDRPNDVVM